MKFSDLFFLLVFGTLLLNACNTNITDAKDAGDSIVGRWRGVGLGAMLAFEVEDDFTLIEYWGSGPDQEVKKGAWSKEGKKYRLFFGGTDTSNPDAGRLFKYTIDGRLYCDEATIFVREDKVEVGVEVEARGDGPTVESISGEWVFIYARNSIYAMAPPFDRTNYLKGGDVVTTSTVASLAVRGKYTISADQLSFTNMGPRKTSNRVTAFMEDGGKTLILIPEGQPSIKPEWIYVRPGQLLPNDEVLGTWRRNLGEDKMSMEVQFLADGHLVKKVRKENGEWMTMPKIDARVQAYYRLWSSKHGTMITMVDIDPSIGLMAESYQYKIIDGALVLTPVKTDNGSDLKLNERERVVYQSQYQSLLCQRPGQVAQHAGAVAVPGAAVHASQRRRLGRGQPLQHLTRVFRVREVIHLFAEGLAGADQVRFDQRRIPRATLSEQIPAEQRGGEFLGQEAAFPRVRQMRRVEPAHGVTAQRQAFSIGKCARRPVGQVADGDHRGHRAAQRRRLRCGRQPLVERAALVGLHM